MPAKTRGFGVSCPHCYDEGATVRLDLNDLNVCSCSSCDAEFSAHEARDLVAAELAKWEAVVRFVESAQLPTP